MPSDFESQSVKTDTQAERIEREEELKQAAAEAKAKAASAKEKAKGKGKKGAQYARDNADNPVFIGNAVLIGALGSVLGYQAYKKYTIGEFTWKVAGIGASIVGVFALGDYYVSKYVLRDKSCLDFALTHSTDTSSRSTLLRNRMLEDLRP